MLPRLLSAIIVPLAVIMLRRRMLPLTLRLLAPLPATTALRLLMALPTTAAMIVVATLPATATLRLLMTLPATAILRLLMALPAATTVIFLMALPAIRTVVVISFMVMPATAAANVHAAISWLWRGVISTASAVISATAVIPATVIHAAGESQSESQGGDKNLLHDGTSVPPARWRHYGDISATPRQRSPGSPSLACRSLSARRHA